MRTQQEPNLKAWEIEDADSQIFFSLGRDKYDNRPASGIAEDWQDFCSIFETYRSPRKGLIYVAAPFGNDRRRCNDNCLPHRFAALDLDGAVRGFMSDEMFAEICFQMSRWRGLRYETFSSTQGDRRARFILELDSEVSREDGMRLRGVIRSLMPKYGNWDMSCDNPAQPLYMPPIGVNVIRFGDEPVCVTKELALAPPLKTYSSRPKIVEDWKTTLVLRTLDRLNMYIREKGNGWHVIICPWCHEHTDGRVEAAYYEPSEKNGVGGFKCLHAHCKERTIAHLLRFVESEMVKGVKHDLKA